MGTTNLDYLIDQKPNVRLILHGLTKRNQNSKNRNEMPKKEEFAVEIDADRVIGGQSDYSHIDYSMTDQEMNQNVKRNHEHDHDHVEDIIMEALFPKNGTNGVNVTTEKYEE